MRSPSVSPLPLFGNHHPGGGNGADSPQPGGPHPHQRRAQPVSHLPVNVKGRGAPHMRLLN